MNFSNNLKAFFIIISTILGLGIFTLPYTFVNSGYYFFLWLFFLNFVFLLLHLIWGEILFQTESKHNLPGLAKIYLHKNLKHLVWIFDYFGMLGVFLIYFVALVKFWSLILPTVDPFYFKILFFAINIYFIFKNLLIFSRFESVLTIAILIFFFFLIAFLLPKFNLENIKIFLPETTYPLLPYGIFLFAFSGTSALPVVYDLLGKNKKSYFKVNLFSLLFITVIYLVYTLLVVGFLGKNVSEGSLESLSHFLPKEFLFLAIFLVTLNITFVDMAFYLKRGLIYDYGFSEKKSNLILFFSIFILIFLKSQNLINLIDIVSSIFLGFNLLIICLIYLKLKKKEYFILPNLLVIFLSFILIIGIIYGLLPK